MPHRRSAVVMLTPSPNGLVSSSEVTSATSRRSGRSVVGAAQRSRHLLPLVRRCAPTRRRVCQGRPADGAVGRRLGCHAARGEHDLRAGAHLRSLPAVLDVAQTTAAPMTTIRAGVALRVEAPGELPRSGGPYENFRDAEHIRVAGLAIRDGRGFTASDRAGAPRVAVVNTTLGSCGPDSPPSAAACSWDRRRQAVRRWSVWPNPLSSSACGTATASRTSTCRSSRLCMTWNSRGIWTGIGPWWSGPTRIPPAWFPLPCAR